MIDLCIPSALGGDTFVRFGANVSKVTVEGCAVEPLSIERSKR